MKRLIPVAVVLAVLIVMAAFTAGGAVRAQSSTPSSTIDMTAAHPVHIHNGTCATLGSIAWPLNDLSAPGAAMTMMGTPVMGTPMAMPTMAANATPMAGMGAVVAESVTVVKVNLADLEKAPFAINAHVSLAKIGTYIACGDITGAIANGKLTVALKQLNTSGLEGNAVLTDNGDGTTTVVIQLSKASGS
jgi:hypothetical protein